ISSGNLPAGFQLFQNYSNPFNPSTTIEFALAKAGWVTLNIYNILGEEVAELVSENLSAGSYKYNWDAGGLASGVYLYQLKAGRFVQTRKMLLIR
ncbi:MAG: T9SS type A sorting domain-containing protein, partial [Anaerolineales bacterium]|nr:T9SS type A sorting domain-containing protein [Anaerolineales bacterium]